MALLRAIGFNGAAPERGKGEIDFNPLRAVSSEIMPFGEPTPAECAKKSSGKREIMITKIKSKLGLGPKLRDVLPLYYDAQVARNRREMTLCNMDILCRWLVRLWGDRPAASITTADIRSLRKPSTASKDRAEAVMSIFRWLHRRKFIPSDITINAFEPPGRKVAKIKFLTPEDAHKFLDAVRPQYKAAFTLALFAGLRPFECCRIKWGNIFLTEKRITVPVEASKTWEFRTFEAERRRYWRITLLGKTIDLLRDVKPGVPGILFDLLAPLAEGYKPDEYVLPANGERTGSQLITRVFPRWIHERRRAAKESGVLLSHDVFRHTFLTYLVALYQDVGLAAKVAGHHDLQMLAAHYDGKAPRKDAEVFFKRAITIGEEPDVMDFPVPEHISRALPLHTEAIDT